MKFKNFIKRLKQPYRLMVFQDKTYQEVWGIRVSRLGLYFFSFFMFIIMIGLFLLLAIYTPMKQFIPGYPSDEVKEKMALAAMKLDSLETRLMQQDRYFSNLNSIVSGGELNNYDKQPDNDTLVLYDNIEFSRSEHDSILRQQIEREEQYSLFASTRNKGRMNFVNLHFFPPLKGLVTNSFNLEESHYGTDIVSSPNKVVSAVLDGTVIMSTWTLETGHIIQIQHENNLLSIYKHNSEILKKTGNHVKAGEAIAIVGNSGELTTGPHLHFELWHDGKPLDPEDYIIF